MSGIYGTIRSANITPLTDVEMFYYYRPTRSTESEDFSGYKILDASCLVRANYEDENNNDELVPLFGVYNLRLPLDKFNKKGFYSVYIRPKEYITTLTDVSVLAAYPDVKGVVIDINNVGGISDLTGYRIEYYDSNGNRVDTTRLITSSNRCEPVLVTVADSYPKATRYRITDTGSNLLFCTVTPSSSTSFKPNVTPFIGIAGGKVSIVNTKFSPMLLEIEMIDHDADTLTYAIEGDQVRDRDQAVITTYNDDKEIYLQQDYYTVKNSLGTPLYDVKKKRVNIDGSQSYDNVITE